MNFYITLLRESLLFALQALRVNRLRTVLSLLGVTIGIFAIISVFTLVDSLENSIKGSIESLGDNVVFVQKWPWTFGQDYPWWKFINRPLPDLDELGAIQKKSKYAQAACFMIGQSATAEYKENAFEAIELAAVSYEYYRVKDLQLASGRYFTISESEGGRPYCIIGADIAGVLFGGGNPIGKSIEVKRQKMKIIGVFQREGESFLGNSQDQQIFIPINFARKFTDISSPRVNPFIMVKALPNVSNQQLIDELTGVMRGMRKLKPKADDSFALNQTSMLTNTFAKLFDVLGIAGGIIGLFSILVGGFSIANIMFVSVKERTGLIGIQKSLGAKNFFILFQFLSEAVFLCLMGGLFGLLIIFSLTLIVNATGKFYLSLSSDNIILGLSLSAAIGTISGIWPAYIASRLDPVEAIRMN